MSLWPINSAFLGGGGAGMPAFVSAAAGQSGTGNRTPSFPSPITAGQFLIIQVYANDTTAPAVTTPGGWTAAGAKPTGAVLAKEWLFWKVADGTESGTVSLTCSGDNMTAARIYLFSNGSGIEAAAGQLNTPSSTSLPAQDITTLGAQRLALQMFAAFVNTTVGNISGETGTDYTEAVAEFAAANVILSFQTGQVPSPTAITGGTATLGAAGIDRVSYGAAIIP